MGKDTEKTKTPLEIAENYVDWAATRRFTAEHVWRTLTTWPHIKLTQQEKEYIRVLANRKCPKNGWAEVLRVGELTGWLKESMKHKNDK